MSAAVIEGKGMSWQPKKIESTWCDACRHDYCQDCEECSASKQYSDFWICHRCGELNKRFQQLEQKWGA